MVNNDILQLDSEGQFFVNNIQRDLPFFLDNIISILYEDDVLKVDYKHHIFIHWYLVTDVTHFISKQWTRGNIYGLLDKNTDQDLSYFESDVNFFRNSTEDPMIQVNQVGQSNLPMANYLSRTAEIKTNASACYELLQSPASTLSSCYVRVNPKPYYALCLNNKNICVSAAAYKKICEIRGAQGLAMPESYGMSRFLDITTFC